MKAVFVGGGAHRLLGIIRGAMADGKTFENGEVCLYDLNKHRAGAMGRMLMKTPEYAKLGCKITWGTSLERALDGADAVSVILMAGSRKSFMLGNQVHLKHGYLSSDNVSPNGAFLAIKGKPILFNIAKKMEKHCPNAWLFDFANPVAVLSAAINNHTQIKCLGVCSGFDNHQWDLTRLMGRDEQCHDYEVEAAGINHMAFILKGSLHGQDLFKLVESHINRPDWKPPKLNPWWSAIARKNMRLGLRKMVQIYNELGVLIFSGEFDGVHHLYYDEALARAKKGHQSQSKAQIEAGIRADLGRREDLDRVFESHLDQDLDAAFWADHWRQDLRFRREDDHIFVRLLRGVAGVKAAKIATSRANEGAVEGIKDRTVLEYSQVLLGDSIKPAGRYCIPDSVHGMVDSLATHQTLLGDAIATEDPHLLVQALLSYPVRPYSKDLRALCKELLRINRDEMPKKLLAARELL